VHRAALDPTRGRFAYSPVSVNFLTEVAKCVFAVALLIYYANQAGPEGKALRSWTSVKAAARKNMLLAGAYTRPLFSST